MQIKHRLFVKEVFSIAKLYRKGGLTLANLSNIDEGTKKIDNLKEEIYINFDIILDEIEGISMKNYDFFDKEYITKGYDSDGEKIKVQLSFNDLLICEFINGEGRFNDYRPVKERYMDILRIIDILDEFIDDLYNSIEQEIIETQQVLNRINHLKEEKL